MKFLPLLKTCIRALVRNPMRAALTILGIIIGIAAVIAMVEIGQGSTLQIKNTIASMGADTLNIRPGAISKSGVNTGAGGRASLTNADCEAIAKDCPMVLRATPVVRASGQVIYGNKNWSPETVEGGSVEYLKIKSWYDMARGQPFSEEDVEQARRVCVIGQTVAKELFGDEDPLGKDIRIKNVMFKVVGIPVGMGFAVGVNEVAETRFGGQESMGIQAFLSAVHFLQMVAKVGKFDSAVASGHRIEPDVIVKQHEIRRNGFMTAVHDGDVAGGPFQKIVKSLPVDVKPGGGDQVIKIGIVFHHMIPAFQKLKHSFPAEIRSGL